MFVPYIFIPHVFGKITDFKQTNNLLNIQKVWRSLSAFVNSVKLYPVA